MADLSAKVAVVTAASRGVGRGIAEGLAEAGATVYVVGGAESFATPPADGTIQATARRVVELGGRSVAVRVDHRNHPELRSLMQRVCDEQGRIDLLVNNLRQAQGGDAVEGPFWEQPLSGWEEHYGAVLRCCYAASAYAAAPMVRQGSGLIVNVLSGHGPERPGLLRQMSMAGLVAMAQHMAADLAPHGVTALAVRVDGSPRFAGRGIAALAMDPDILEKSGGAFGLDALAAEYRFTEPDAD